MGDQERTLVQQNAPAVSSTMPVSIELRVFLIRRTPACPAGRTPKIGLSRSESILPLSAAAMPNEFTQQTESRFGRLLHFSTEHRKSAVVACCATRYSSSVIKSFKHKGLRRYYETGNKSGIQVKHAARLRLQLAALDTARVIDDMKVPGYRLHPLKGRAKDRWSIWVSGNWRLTFEFRDGNAYVLDYEDYH